MDPAPLPPLASTSLPLHWDWDATLPVVELWGYIPGGCLGEGVIVNRRKGEEGRGE